MRSYAWGRQGLPKTFLGAAYGAVGMVMGLWGVVMGCGGMGAGKLVD